MRRVDTRQRRLGRLPRTSQILFGERQSLQNALRLLRSTRLPASRRRLEEGVLRQMIVLRTRELTPIRPGWAGRWHRAPRRSTSAGELRRLARRAPREDYY